ncbi:hypothetical protein J2T11_002409 [Paenarthrobacter nicotinovorans]|uniref:hypothetical protein n=1 Tax=Paenarthrobacter nicotinovorans TaxID=29320 RepID=UPI0027847BE3|nr:hypothetical protein [Paenarthrobacter nicotinovorans]MDP9936050.1 hypothetical protein [Paenarthrobacter nicotinovorans]
MNDDSWTDEAEYGLIAAGTRHSWRYGSKARVVIGGGGLAIGVAVAHLTFCLLLTLQLPGWAVLFFIYSLLPVWAVGAGVGSLLGLALRRVRNQWVHVAAFFAVPLLVCVPVGGLSQDGSVLLALSVAVAGGVGRLSIWKLVRVNDPGPGHGM